MKKTGETSMETGGGLTAHSLPRTFFSLYHLRAADMFANQAEKLENDENYDGEDKRHGVYVIYSIIASVSFLDSEVNGFLIDFEEEDERYDDFNQQTKKLVRLWMECKRQKLRTMGPLETMNKALELCNKDQFEEGKELYQNADLVKEVRNHFVHHTPEFLPEGEKGLIEEHSFVGGLKTKDFDLNPFDNSENPFFPYQVLGSGFAKWSLESCLNFADEFWNKIGKEPRYNSLKNKLEIN